jgi:hypothetical protein
MLKMPSMRVGPSGGNRGVSTVPSEVDVVGVSLIAMAGPVGQSGSMP